VAWLGVAAIAGVALGACRRQEPLGPGEREAPWTPAPVAGEAIVARVGAVPVFAADVMDEARRTGRTPAQALEVLVRFHLLAEKARSSGVAPPGAQDEEKSLLVQRLLERDFEPRARPADVPQRELRAVYDRAIHLFVHSRLVELAVLSVYTGERMKPEPRARARATAQALAAHVERVRPKTPEELLAVALDPAWAERKVKGIRVWQSDRQPFSPKLGAAALKLRRRGELTPLVDDETGHHIAMYLAERPPENVSFEAVEERLRAELHPTWQKQRFLDFVKQIAATRKVELVPAAVPLPALSSPSAGQAASATGS
jgi:hypothetical protein